MANLTFSPDHITRTVAGESDNRQEMAPIHRLLLGGVAGITPMLVTFAAGDYVAVFQDAATSPENFAIYSIGMLMKGAVFFAIGALLVWLHSSVRTRYAVFRLGLTAPALVAASISAHNANEASGNQQSAELIAPQALVAMLEPASTNFVISDALLPAVVFQQQQRKCTVLDGFLGRKCK